MTQHKNLARGIWGELLFCEQMANIGSEVGRALNWKGRHNADYCQRAFDRSLELIDLTLGTIRGFARLKEVARLREAIADYFFGENQFMLTEVSLKKYFSNFVYAVRKGH